ncbi:acyltransferase, WS/DGAT/MGAT [Lentzea flava]|nr:acyltransferase, WS/DGAT/MGAT [Lentzea flava]
MPGLADLIGQFADTLPTLLTTVRTAAQISADIGAHLRILSGPTALSAPTNTTRPPARRLEMVRLRTADVTAIRRRHGGTTHDVLLTLLAGALHTWLDSHGQSAHRNIRALVPVAQHTRARDANTGNRLSGYLCTLPVAEPDPLHRLRLVRTEMDRNKAAGPHRGPGAFPVVAGLFPHAVHHVVTPLLAAQVNRLFDLVATAVRLPARLPGLGGTPVSEIYPLAPLAPGYALAVAFTHDPRHVHITLTTDPHALDGVDKLTEALHSGLTELLHATTS